MSCLELHTFNSFKVCWFSVPKGLHFTGTQPSQNSHTVFNTPQPPLQMYRHTHANRRQLPFRHTLLPNNTQRTPWCTSTEEAVKGSRRNIFPTTAQVGALAHECTTHPHRTDPKYTSHETPDTQSIVQPPAMRDKPFLDICGQESRTIPAEPPQSQHHKMHPDCYALMTARVAVQITCSPTHLTGCQEAYNQAVPTAAAAAASIRPFDGAASWLAALAACSTPDTQGSSGSSPIWRRTVACSTCSTCNIHRAGGRACAVSMLAATSATLGSV